MGIFSSNDGRKERFETLRQTVDLGIKHFRRTGAALKEIRDQELYRVSYATFEQCCTAEWQITVRHANNLIAAHETAEQLGTAVPDSVAERTLRPLTSLPLDQRAAAWQEALADGATTDSVERAVAKRKPRKKKSAVAKPLRFRLPGATIVITPNKKYHGLQKTIEFLLNATAAAARDAA